MSTRVQKGNTVFRPVARARARPGGESRQASVVADSGQSVGPVADSVRPPTPIAPSRGPPTIASSQPSSGIVIVVPSRSVSIHPLSSQVTSNATPTRLAVTPILPPTEARKAAFSNSAHSEQTLVPDPTNSQNFSSSFDPSQIDPQLFPSTDVTGSRSQGIEQGALFGASVENRPRVAPDSSSSVNVPRPRRKASRKGAVDSNPDQEGNYEPREAVQESESGTAPKKKRFRKRIAENTDEEERSESGPKRRRVRSSTTPRPRSGRTRAPSPPPFDADMDPGEELDPTVTTMAALCDDTGHGRVSSRAAAIVSNHAAWRATNREKRARMKAILEAKKYGRNLEDEDERPNKTSDANSEVDQNGGASETVPSTSATAPVPGSSALDIQVEEGAPSGGVDGFDYTEHMAISRYNVQVRIGPNGETIIDEESLFVNRDEEHHTEEYTHVEESDMSKFVNSSTYSKKSRGSRWSAEETELFYDALSQFGENYELISYVLPGRDRKACKNKFKTEDKKNPARITYCLNNRRPYDIQTLSRMTGKDFSGPTPIIRAPTPLRSTELEINADPGSMETPQAIRKKSRTPAVHPDEEILGDIDDVDKEESADTFDARTLENGEILLPVIA
ncbi:Transcription factor TFIIIB component B'' [Grifola frondosa]|uniref:Transcription factor TFIIIB component B n=1 Tax=Grifola frondosa TaxID=5627 RepID=A0A1C7LUP2_GRIFR|nr:Transcription factor TFIIIB component B'' [Grifola frondosa]